MGNRAGVVAMSLSDEEREALWDDIDKMQSKLQTAIDQEHYEEAATLRDAIKELKVKDPYSKAELELEGAVKEEKYEDAARLRARMKEVGKPPLRRRRDDAMALQGILAGDGASVGERSGIKTYSETVTRGTRISVESFYVPEPSAPKDGRFMCG
jgi:ApaG protein